MKQRHQHMEEDNDSSDENVFMKIDFPSWIHIINTNCYKYQFRKSKLNTIYALNQLCNLSK